MLAHAQVVVAAPDDDIVLAAVGAAPGGAREAALLADDVDEGAVAAFLVQPVQRGVELGVVIHSQVLFAVPDLVTDPGSQPQTTGCRLD